MRSKLQNFLLFILTFGSLSGLGQNAVQVATNQVVKSQDMVGATFSFLAIDLSTGAEIASNNPNMSIPTASTAKLFSTATALEILGPDYRPETRIYIEGTISKDGRLDGNIWIRGGGDVTLGSRFFNESGHERDFLKTWVDTLKFLGIKSVSGSIIADGSAFGYAGIPDGWSWNDMGNYYGAGPSGICVFDNAIRFVFKTGTSGSATEIVSMSPTVPGMTFHNYVKSAAIDDDQSYIFGAPYSLDRFATGSLPAGRASFEVKGSVPDPEIQLAFELVTELEKAGINIAKGYKGVRRDDLEQTPKYGSGFSLAYTHKGQRVKEIATLTNMKSINLFAEGLLCLVGYKLNGKGSTEDGLKQLEKYWGAKASFSGLFLKDGSGLSRSNGISATHFCTLLKAMNGSKHYALYLSTLPVAGKSGTLTGLCNGQAGEGRIVAKSGTMSRIKSYAGYVNSKSGKKIAFAITINNFNGSSSQATAKIEQILNALAAY
jgi:D-alanyl-D-alanine carboxypeptidase/D-alanyl-D-alanine-endopeptidase (penicillin-binding protein 4)